MNTIANFTLPVERLEDSKKTATVRYVPLGIPASILVHGLHCLIDRQALLEQYVPGTVCLLHTSHVQNSPNNDVHLDPLILCMST